MTDDLMSPKVAVAASLAATLVVAWLDYATGLELGVSALYLLPVLLAAWFAGWRWAVALALLNAAALSVVNTLSGHLYSHPFYQGWELLNHALVYLSVAVAVVALRQALGREKALNLELNWAIEEVGELKGLLPVCAWCHKVRDDQGYWGQLETYIEARTHASFTHGICPDCQVTVMAERRGNTGEQPALEITPPPPSPSN